MAFPQKYLNENEELVLDLRPHWMAMVKATLSLVLAIVIGIVVGTRGWGETLGKVTSALSLLLIVVAGGYFIVKLLGWMSTNFVLTSDRIITRRGVLTKSGIEIPLERVNTVFFNQRLVERMMGAGDLSIESAGQFGNEHMTNIRKPAVVQREIYVQMEANENRKFDRVSGGVPISAAEQLEKLAELLQQGMISQEQFDAERTRLLG